MSFDQEQIELLILDSRADVQNQMMSLREARERAAKLTDAMYYQNAAENIVIIKIQKNV